MGTPPIALPPGCVAGGSDVVKEIIFDIPGKPQGKARARTFYNPGLQRMQSITPEKTVLYENLIKTAYLHAAKGQELDEGALEVGIEAVFEPPKSISKKRRAAMLDGTEPHQTAPDVDNICKAVMDALNGVAYPDDKRVVSVNVQKHYGATAHVRVRLRLASLPLDQKG